ncbi:MAG: TonB-dependent receptor [Capnocytophaga sp.]|nr:TonB-dependent receptor [Capnocytophaga sp.]
MLSNIAKTYKLVFIIIFYSQYNFSQERTEEKDKVIDLEEVVVSSTQIQPQSLKKSINNVRVITQQDIVRLGAVNLADVLNQYINITVLPDDETGRSTISMFGLGANYFKVLVDNIPLVNESGLGNNIDLSQINLDDIEQIEIIEGSMGVTHGANAVSGILNIITKRKFQHQTEINFSIQEESAGNEYNFSDKGRHIQAFKASHNINTHWAASFGVNRNNFNGFLGDRQGKLHLASDALRGYKWLPRENILSNAMINYSKNRISLFYKFEYMTEQIDYYDRQVKQRYSDILGSYRYGDDRRYFTDRLYNHLNSSGRFKDFNYNISASYQIQSRKQEDFSYNITHNLETNNSTKKDQEMKVFLSTGSISNFIKNEMFNVQLGYDITVNKGFSLISDVGHTTKEVSKYVNNYDAYINTDVNLTSRFSLRPGFRYSFQELFDNQYAYSLGVRQLFDNGLEARASIGKSYRTPSFTELYFKMIFDGHHFTGNEELTPEQSFSTEMSFKKTTLFNNPQTKLYNNLILSHINIKDRITSAFIGFEGATPVYKYINISSYKLFNLSSTNQFTHNNLDLNLGASLSWISQIIDNNEYKTDDRYFFRMNFNGSASYTFPKWDTTLTVFYKYLGASNQWIGGVGGYNISEVEATNWLDASVQKSFANRKFEISLGVKNILNVTEAGVSRTGVSGQHVDTSSLFLSNGTSYFVKLIYNLNIN